MVIITLQFLFLFLLRWIRSYLDAEFKSVSIYFCSFFVADGHHHLKHLIHISLKRKSEKLILFDVVLMMR